MSTVTLETYLARLYTDPAALEWFLADPAGATRAAGLAQVDADALCKIDRAWLCMAASSYTRKRGQHRHSKKKLFGISLP